MKYLKETMNNCLECGKRLYGRNDKKFCNIKCKNDFHNSHARCLTMEKNRKMHKLLLNYNILYDLLDNRQTSETLELLERLGYSKDFFTEYRRNGEDTEYACFDILYHRDETRIYDLRREESC